MPTHLTRIEPSATLPATTSYQEGYPLVWDELHPGVVITADPINSDWKNALGAVVTNTYAHTTPIGPDAACTQANQVTLGAAQDVVTHPGGIELAVTTQTAAYTIDASGRQTVVLADATTATFAVTLPTAVAGRVVVVKKIDSTANAVTVETPGAETIDGAANHSLATQYDVVRLITDGTNWFVI